MLPVENMEDLILVARCTLATSWAVALFGGTHASGLQRRDDIYDGRAQFFLAQQS